MPNCMQKAYVLLFCFAAFICDSTAFAQDKADSTLEALGQIPVKYINTIDKKIDKYSSRVSSKTLKTLTKLSRWENKLKNTLQKVNPDAATKLFGNNQLTFSSLLQQIQKGEAIKLEYRRQYDKYRDDLTTGIKYLEKQKEFLDSGVTKRLQGAKEKLQQLNNYEDSTEAIQQFIKERKKEIITTAFKHLGKSKWLTKMNKETWYYAETIKNYKDIFNDEAKTEKLVKDVLWQIPGFQNFVQKNSMLAGLFGSPAGDVADATAYAGLQTRAGVQQLIQSRIAAGGPGAQDVFKQNMNQAQAQLNVYKDKLLKAGSGAGTGEGGLPDFKPNIQKTKTFLQRLEFGSNLQFARSNSLMPTTADIALTVGYKLNDKSVAGIGAGYKLGMGSIDKIRFSTEGISLRSFIDWKLKKQFYISGGWEMNYLSFPATGTEVKLEAWQQSALAGISKKFAVRTKLFKQTKLQLLYDFLAKQYMPVRQHWLFRVGYSL